jgi:hypothetical protein
MDPATYGFIGALVGAIVGASASIGTTFISSWNSSRLQMKADNFQRIERARIFQRDTLLKIQESIQDAMRNAGQMHHQDVLAHREGGVWQKSLLGEELNNKVLNVNRELSLLTERVSNDELRDNIKLFRNKLSDCLFTASEDKGGFKFKQATDSWTPLMEHIGKVLRENY